MNIYGFYVKTAEGMAVLQILLCVLYVADVITCPLWVACLPGIIWATIWSLVGLFVTGSLSVRDPDEEWPEEE